MRTIHKFRLGFRDYQEVAMPKGAKILSVAEQQGGLYLWAAVTTENDEEEALIRICGTGHPSASQGEFIGTVVMSNGLVWHVFKEGVV